MQEQTRQDRDAAALASQLQRPENADILHIFEQTPTRFSFGSQWQVVDISEFPENMAEFFAEHNASALLNPEQSKRWELMLEACEGKAAWSGAVVHMARKQLLSER